MLDVACFPRSRAALAIVGAIWLLPAAARAQRTAACDAGSGRSVGAASGRRITAITVESAAPHRLPGGIPASLHVTTREGTIRSRLLFAVGDTVDTLRVAESVRQLRRLRYLAAAVVTVVCDDDGGAALTIATRDAWSLRPRLALRGASQTVGLEETNLLGTGRAGRVYARSDGGQFGVGVGYADPTLFGGRAVASVSRDAFAHGSGWGATVRTADAGVFAPWELGLALRQTARQSLGRTSSAPGDTVRRAAAELLVARRLTLSPAGGTYLQFGAEAGRTAIVAGPDLPLVGPPSVRRTFAAVDVGGVRRSGLFVDVPWLLPAANDAERGGLARAEIPLGLEWDVVVGLGRDLGAGRPAAHTDAWVGRVWPLGSRASADERVPTALLSADLWAAGYRTRGAGEWSGGTLRAALGLVAPARHGLWSASVSAEQLADPDPDVHALSFTGAALRAMPGRTRLAESVAEGSFERSRHLRRVGRNYTLDVAGFGAGAIRWDGARAATDSGASPAGYERAYVGTLGAGLRLTPTRVSLATIRFDAGLPVVRSSSVPRRPYFALSIVPTFSAGRERAGRAALVGP
jgi:hypothetical protein